MLFSRSALGFLFTAATALAAPVVEINGELTARATKAISSIVVFGDSFSDGGAGSWTVSKQTWPPVAYYPTHRFTNGVTYIEQIAALLNVPITNYAVGGATTDDNLVQGYTGAGGNISVPSVARQVLSYLRSTPHPSASTLHVIYSGANDAFFGLPGVTGTQSAAAVATWVAKLEQAGAKMILLPTLPPLGTNYPASTFDTSLAAPLLTFSTQFFRSLYRLDSSDSLVVVSDLFNLFNKIAASPRTYRFDPTKTSQSCLQGVYGETTGPVSVCADPSKYIWWDLYHPSKAAHNLIAQQVLADLKAAGWA